MNAVEKRIRAWVLNHERAKAGVKAPPQGTPAAEVGCCGAPTPALCNQPLCPCNPKSAQL